MAEHESFSESATLDDDTLPRDPEEAQRALAEVQDLLRRRAVAAEAAEHPDAAGGPDMPAAPEADGAVDPLLNRLQARLADMHPADVAYILEALPPEERLVVWELIKSAERDGEILVEATEWVREWLIRSMDRAELLAAAETLDTDDLADIAVDLPQDVVEEVRRGLTAEEREQLRAAMSYPEDSVGARMDFDMVTIPDNVTLDYVLAELRRLDELPDHTDQIFVVDASDVFKGVLPIDRLLTNQPEAMVEDVMVSETLTLQALDDVREAAGAFERYDLVSAPVVDPHGRLIGRLTVAEVVDIILEEGESERLSQAGLIEEEDLFASVWASARNRWLWLGVNLCTAFFASRVIGAFEGTIERVVALAALMPIVAGIAGNSGNQTMTLFIRSLALGQVTASNARRLILKELAVAGLNGLVWGGVAGVLAWLLYRGTPNGWLLGLTMMAAMMLNLLLGALVGMLVPLLLQRIGRDPAMGSSVLLTFITDSMGFFIFLGLATLLFR